MDSPYLSVVIPSFNETENLKAGVLDQVASYLGTQKYTWEVIVSDDGSPDPTARRLAQDYCAQNPHFRFLENEHGGKPFAIWSGIESARAEIVLLTDMDQSTPIKELEKLLPFYDQGYDVVIGGRGVERKNSSAFRRLASDIFRTLRRLFLLPNIIDTQCGFKTLKRSIATEVFPKMDVIKRGKPKDSNWHVGAWDTEFLFITQKYGYKIKEVPVSWENRDLAMETKNSTSKSKFVKESLEMVEEMIKIRANDLKGNYRK